MSPEAKDRDLAWFNTLPPSVAVDELLRCCHSRVWARAVAGARPYRDFVELCLASDAAADALTREDWLEAFRGHPKIGDRKALEAKFASTAQWAKGEQQGAAQASSDVLDALSKGNAAYEARFGFIFIVCATGKTAAEMLALLQARLSATPDQEWATAAGEQRKITRIRLEKLFTIQ